MAEGVDEEDLSLSAFFSTDGGERLPELSADGDAPSLAAIVAAGTPPEAGALALVGAAEFDPVEAFMDTFGGTEAVAAAAAMAAAAAAAGAPPPGAGPAVDDPTTGDLWLAATAATANALPPVLLTPLALDDGQGGAGGLGGWPTLPTPNAPDAVDGDAGNTLDAAGVVSPVSMFAPDAFATAVGAPSPPAAAAAPPPPTAVVQPPPAVAAVPVRAAVAPPPPPTAVGGAPGVSATSLASDTSRVTHAAGASPAVAAASRARPPAASTGLASAGSAGSDPWAGPAGALSAVARAQQQAEDIAVREVASRRAKAKRGRAGGGAGGPAAKRARGAAAAASGGDDADGDDGGGDGAAGEADDADAPPPGSDAEKSRRYQKRLQKNRDSAFVSRIRRRHYTSILESSLEKEEAEKRSLGGAVDALRAQVAKLTAELVAARGPAAAPGAPPAAVPLPPMRLPAGVPPASGSASSTARCPPSSSTLTPYGVAPAATGDSPVSSSASGPPYYHATGAPTIRTRFGATVASRTAARPAMVTTLLVAAVILGFCVPVAFLPEIASVAATWAARPLARWAAGDRLAASARAPPLGPPYAPVPRIKREQCLPGDDADWTPRARMDGDRVPARPSLVPVEEEGDRCADAFFDRIFIRDDAAAASSSSSAFMGRGGGARDYLTVPVPPLAPTAGPRPPVVGPHLPAAPGAGPSMWSPQPSALPVSPWAKDTARGSRTPPVGTALPEPLPARAMPPPPPTVVLRPPTAAAAVEPPPRVRAWAANVSDGSAEEAGRSRAGGRVWAVPVWSPLAGDRSVAADGTPPLHLICDELATVVDASVGAWPADVKVGPRAGGCSSSSSSSSSSRSSSSSGGCDTVHPRVKPEPHPAATAADARARSARSSRKGKEPAYPARKAVPLPPPRGDPPAPAPAALLPPTAAAAVTRPWRAARPWAAAAATAAAAAPAAGTRLWRDVHTWAAARVEAMFAPGGQLARVLTTAPEERLLGDVVHLLLLNAYADGAARAKAPV